MRKLCYKVIVDAIEPMDADNLECAKICGWRVVVRKGEFKPGDTALYFEIDSCLNSHDDRFAFLKERCYKRFNSYGKIIDEGLRIKTMKLRGVVSQGLLLPVEQFCEVRNAAIGEDCSPMLAVRHYDEMYERVLKITQKITNANQKGLFPSFIPKTDEERIQNIEQDEINRLADIPLEVTVKRDGSSMTVFYAGKTRPEEPFGICSRNFELKPEMGSWWNPVMKYDLQNKLSEYCECTGNELAIQGELIGPGMNGNRDCLDELDWHVFRIWDIARKCWLSWKDRYAVCYELGLHHVPIIGVKTMNDFGCNRDAMLEFAEGKTENGNEREGLVWKSEDGSFSFKTVSNRYLLKLKD